MGRCKKERMLLAAATVLLMLCAPPVNVFASSFDGETTKFSELNCSYSDMQNLTLEKSAFGRINFLEPVSFARDAYLNTNVSISDKSISVNANDLPELSKMMQVVLRNVFVAQPKILRDGIDCVAAGKCTIVSYDAASGVLVFNTT